VGKAVLIVVESNSSFCLDPILQEENKSYPSFEVGKVVLIVVVISNSSSCLDPILQVQHSSLARDDELAVSVLWVIYTAV
jgi:hypothetical protein